MLFPERSNQSYHQQNYNMKKQKQTIEFIEDQWGSIKYILKVNIIKQSKKSKKLIKPKNYVYTRI
jgi:hypothetical protein